MPDSLSRELMSLQQANCANGGVMYTSADGIHFVCNGPQGPKGDAYRGLRPIAPEAVRAVCSVTGQMAIRRSTMT